MNSRVFWWKKKCAIAERAVFSARHTALICIEAAPMSCEFQIGILAKEDAKFGAPRAEIMKKLQQIHASMMQIFAKFCDRWMRVFLALHPSQTRRRNSATSKCFRSDAGRNSGALHVDRAKNCNEFAAIWLCLTQHGWLEL